MTSSMTMTGTQRLLAILLLSTVLLGTSACTIQVGGDTGSCAVWPVFPETERPTLAPTTRQELEPLTEETRKKLLLNDHLLKNHAKRLEAQITTYNDLRHERFGD